MWKLGRTNTATVLGSYVPWLACACLTFVAITGVSGWYLGEGWDSNLETMFSAAKLCAAVATTIVALVKVPDLWNVMRERGVEETKKARRENVEWIYNNINRGEGYARRGFAKRFWKNLPGVDEKGGVKEVQERCREWLNCHPITDEELIDHLEQAASNKNKTTWVADIPDSANADVWNCKSSSERTEELCEDTSVSASIATADALERFEHLARLIEIEAFSIDVIRRFFYTTLFESFVDFSPHIYFHRYSRGKQQFAARFEMLARWAAGVAVERADKGKIQKAAVTE